jgi:hypothetical protein
MLFMMVKDKQVERRGNGRYITGPTAPVKAAPPAPPAPSAAVPAPQPVQQPTQQPLDAARDAAAPAHSTGPPGGSTPRQKTTYDHDKNRVREARKLARAGKYEKAKTKAQDVRSRKSRETLLEWIAKLERGDGTAEEDDQT